MLSHDLKCELGRYSTTGEAPSDQEQAIDLCGQSVFRQLHHRDVGDAVAACSLQSWLVAWQLRQGGTSQHSQG